MDSFILDITSLFHLLLRTTMNASVIVCIVITAKALLSKRLAPRWHYYLWLLVIARMLMPSAPQSSLSIFNLVPSLTRSQATIDQLATQPAGNTTKHYQQTPTNYSAIENSTKSKETTNSLALKGQLPSQSDTTEYTAIEQQITTQPAAAASLKHQTDYIALLPLVWLIGAIVLALYVFAGNIRLWSIIRQKRPVTDSNILNLLEDCKSQMKLHTYLSVVETGKVSSPALFGFIRPRLLLPLGLLEKLTPAQLRHVFLHELAHLKRGDIYIGWLTALLQTLHWFNPIVWFAFHKMRADRELACDQLALTSILNEEPNEYGKTIVKLLENFSAPTYNPGLAGILEDRSQLKRRITMIAKHKKGSYRFSTLAAIVMILLSAIALTNAKDATPLEEKKKNANTFADLLIDGQFKKATQTFDKTMSKSLPAKRLAKIWKETTDQAGPFQEKLGTRSEKYLWSDIIYITCQFENGPLDIKVVYNRNMRITGLWFKPVPQKVLEEYANQTEPLNSSAPDNSPMLRTGKNTSAEAAYIVQKVVDRYADMKTFQAFGELRIEINRDPDGKAGVLKKMLNSVRKKPLESIFAIKLARPRRYCVEWNANYNSRASQINQIGYGWSTGEGSHRLQFGKSTQNEKNSITLISVDHYTKQTSLFFDTSENYLKELRQRSLLKDEQIGGVDCYVITGKHHTVTCTYWISKDKYLLLQYRHVTGGNIDEVMEVALKKMRNGATPEQIAKLKKQFADAKKAAVKSIQTYTQTYRNIIIDEPITEGNFKPSEDIDDIRKKLKEMAALPEAKTKVSLTDEKTKLREIIKTKSKPVGKLRIPVNLQAHLGVWEMVEVKGQNDAKAKTAKITFKPDGTVVSEGTDTNGKYNIGEMPYIFDNNKLKIIGNEWADISLEDGRLIIISAGTKFIYVKKDSPTETKVRKGTEQLSGAQKGELFSMFMTIGSTCEHIGKMLEGNKIDESLELCKTIDEICPKMQVIAKGTDFEVIVVAGTGQFKILHDAVKNKDAELAKTYLKTLVELGNQSSGMFMKLMEPKSTARPAAERAKAIAATQEKSHIHPTSTINKDGQIIDKVPGKLIFHGRYRHRSRGRDIDVPSELWLKQSPQGINALAYLPWMNNSDIASGDADHQITSYRSQRVTTQDQPAYSINLKFTDGKALVTRRGIRDDLTNAKLTVPSASRFSPNSRPDSYCAANISLRSLNLEPGESKELQVYDWDNSGETLVDYKIQITHAGKEPITVPAGTFHTNHFILNQLTSADTWFKKRAGHVTDFWVTENDVIIRVLRHREPYEMVLLDYTSPEDLGGRANTTAENPPLDVKTSSTSNSKKYVYLPDCDNTRVMLDLASGGLVEIPDLQAPKELLPAIDKLSKGDIIFDTRSLTFLRGASCSDSIPHPAGLSLTIHKIPEDKLLPEKITVTNRQGTAYELEILSVDKGGCNIKYIPSTIVQSN